MADEEKVTVAGPRASTRGAQVRLTGEAQEAARGGMADDMEGNLIAKQAMEADGTVADGLSADGTTRTGEQQADVVVTQGGETPGEIPAAPGTTRVETTAEPAPPPPDPKTTAPAKPPPAPAAKG